MKDEIIKAYDTTFYDLVESRIENMNYDLEENYKYKNLTESDVKCIASKVQDNDYMWEIINECIDVELNYFIEKYL